MSVSTTYLLVFLSIPALLIAVFVRSLVRIVRKRGAAGVSDYFFLVSSFCVVYFPAKGLWEYEKSEREAAQNWALECAADYGRESDECRQAFERLDCRGWEMEQAELSDLEP